MIKAVIFDMDGVLIDSEPIWRKVEAKVYQAMGLPVTEKTLLVTTGVRIDMAVEHIYNLYPWGPSPTKVEVVERILTGMENAIGRRSSTAIKTLVESVSPREEVHEALALCKKKGVKLALASSSPIRLIKVTLETLELTHYFDVIHSGDHEKHAKPAPDIYLTTAHMLHVKPEKCVAIEDSPVGVVSAKAAGMLCVAIVDPHHKDDPRYEIADIQLKSLIEFNETIWNKLNAGKLSSIKS